MSLTEEEIINNSIVKVAIHGRIAGSIKIAALNDFFKLHFSEGRNKFIIDLHETDFIGSGGLGVVVEKSKESIDLGGEMVVCTLCDEMKELFRITNLDKKIKIFDTVEDAKAFFS
ncbi:MAG: STAS domain-containing protein [Nitrospinae bacterium]|nr:STAS domain-containing protein [Nitrospinota bacterium]